MKRYLVLAAVLGLGLAADLAGRNKVRAEDAKKYIDMKAEFAVADILKTALAADQKVVVLLRNGKEYAARVKSVGNHAAVLKEPFGKEFFDVYVVLSEVAAVEARVRDR